MNAFLLSATKSIPIQALPEEAWTYLTGKSSPEGTDAAARYANVPYLFRAITLRTQALAALPYSWHMEDEGGDEMESDPPFPFECELSHLLAHLEMSVLLYGAGYVLKERNRGRVVKSLRVLHPASIVPEYDEQQGIKGYKRTIGGQVVYLQPDEVIPVWTPPIGAEIGYGVGEAQVALRAAGVLYNLDEFATRFFAQGAVNPTVISVPQTTLPADQERLQSWYKRMLTGVKKAFTLTVVSGDVKATQLGYPVNQLATPELTASKRQDICTALGIPQSLMDSNAANYATARQDDLHFYGKTVVPRAEMIADALNDGLFEPLGYALVFHPERLECYQAQEADKAQGLTSLVQAGILTVDEARARLELPPLNDPEEMTNDPETPEQESPDMPPEMADSETEDELMPEMRRWQAVIRKRYAEGKPEKALTFKSDVIPAPLMAAIKAQLEDATEFAEALAIVSSVVNWNDYP